MKRFKKTLDGIKQRCNNKNTIGFKYYGGKGIKCLVTAAELKEMWVRDGAGSMRRPSIDRVDSNGDYVYANLRWLELSENSRRAHLLGEVALTQRQRDAKRETTFCRIGIDLLNDIKKFAKENNVTVVNAIDEALRAGLAEEIESERFAKATEQGGR